ncbi:hypothetical protein O4H49_11405 [Kiloniella laminariae]|uniref:Glycerophosphoryl diester phosphodiesterase membrane domain-containing protein n=1 Tax=Kiloniella laminariae TaxID=454162 RepID=A0ABT4LJV5_9PROT|nr:hypothetical protein [Kiloniella laminariae]MCZ4281388.1 hypothetical protein [Kiloniella laminariae]
MTIDREFGRAVAPIAVGKAISEAFYPLFKNGKTALKLAIFPALTITLVSVLSIYLSTELIISDLSNPGNFNPGSAVQQLALSFATTLFSLLIFLQFYICWIRFLYKGESSMKSGLITSLQKRNWIALGKFLLLVIASYIVAAVFMIIFAFALEDFIPEFVKVGFFLVLLAIYFTLFLRFSYVIPAAALDEPYSFGDSWRHTRGQSLKLFVSFFLLALILFIALFILAIVLFLLSGLISLFFPMMGGIENLVPFLIGMMTTYRFLYLQLPLQLFAVVITFFMFLPYLNMLLYCFRTNTGWADDHEIAERFS